MNTVDSRGEIWGPDFLHSFADLVVLAQRSKLIDDALGDALVTKALDEKRAAVRALNHARELREVLYELFRAEATGQPIPTPSHLALQVAFQEALQRREIFNVGDRLVWDWSDRDDLDMLVYRFVFRGTELLLSREHRREIRQCAGKNCGWLFLDVSRGGHRRWCSDESCGVSDRVGRFRAKSKT